jgi:transcription antitermination factor NusG
MLELSNEKTIEQTMRRIGKAIPAIFRSEPVEIFVPVFARDLDVFEMKTGIYIFIRTSGLQALLRLKTITGVVNLVTEGNTNYPNKAILAQDSYVQEVIRDIEKEFWARSKDLKVGNFVRVIDGETRDYCGKIEVLQGDIACVRINLKTKSILVETPIRNLLNLSHVPEEQRVFYYGPIIASLIEDDPENKALIAPDLKTIEEEVLTKSLPEIQQSVNFDEPLRYSRQRTITALVKRLVFEGVNNPMEIAKVVVSSIKRKDIKAPKNLFIVYCIIKDNLMKNYFKKLNPKLVNYREVIHTYGRQYKFSANAIAKIDPLLDVPVFTIEPAKDGRSREARLKKKLEQEKKTKKKSSIKRRNEQSSHRGRSKISK